MITEVRFNCPSCPTRQIIQSDDPKFNPVRMTVELCPNCGHGMVPGSIVRLGDEPAGSPITGLQTF
jgi:predicted RNA-binding Zn-ribbon protein involved in translation (DUF1610 family)